MSGVEYRLPEKTDWFKEQNQHQATLEYAQEIFRVVSDHPYVNALEVGCIWGVSTITILQAGSGSLMSVDPIPQNNQRMHAYVEVRHNGYLDRWQSFTGRSEEFWAVNKNKFDLIYIDGSHAYKEAHLDLFSAWVCLEKGGILLTDDYLHDHNHDSDYGVSLAVLELMQSKQIVPEHMGKHCIGFVK